MATEKNQLGLDIGGTSIKVAFLRCDCADSPTAKRLTARSRTYARPTLDELATRMKETIASMDGLHPSMLTDAAVGVAVPGPVENNVLVQASNLPALAGRDVGRWVQDVLMLDHRAIMITDQLAAAISESQIDQLRGRVIYLSIGTGVGGAILDDGKPLTITRGSPGHIGHMDVSGGDPDAPRLDGSGRGALQAYLGAKVLEDAGVILQPGKCFDHPAMRRGLDALVRGLRIMMAIYRPNAVVLLGGIGLMLGPVLNELKEKVMDDISPVAPEQWTLTLGQGDTFAAAEGAARYARNQNV